MRKKSFHLPYACVNCLLGGRGLLLVVFSFWLGACGMSAAREVPKAYLFEVPFEQPVKANPGGKVLTVSMPRGAPGFDSNRMLYVREAHNLEAYTQSTWVDTPARMLLPLLVYSLETTGEFAAVLSAPTAPITGELQLDTEILRFQQEFLSQSSELRVVLRAQLLNMASHRVLATQVFELTEPAPSENAEGGVRAANRALKRLLAAINAFVIANQAP